jgi:hypothetical protein
LEKFDEFVNGMLTILEFGTTDVDAFFGLP